MSNLYQIMRQLNSDKSQSSSIGETVQSPEKSSTDVTPTTKHCGKIEIKNVPAKALYAPLNDTFVMDNNGVAQMTNGISHNQKDNGGKLSSFLNRHVGTPSRDILVPGDTGSVVSELTFDHALRPLAHQVLATLAARRIQEEVASCESGESSFTPRTRGNATAVSEETSGAADHYFHNSFQTSTAEDSLPPLYERAHDPDDASVRGMHQPAVTPSPQTSLRNLMMNGTTRDNNHNNKDLPSQVSSGQDGTDESLQYSEQDSVFTSDYSLFSVSTHGYSVKSKSSTLRFAPVETVKEEDVSQRDDDADTPTEELEEAAAHHASNVITGSHHLPSQPPRRDKTDDASTVANDCATYFSSDTGSCDDDDYDDDASESRVSTITPSGRTKTRSTEFMSAEASVGDDSNTTNRASNMASDDSADACSEDEETCSQSEDETQFTSETQTVATSVLSNEQQDNLAGVATEADVELKTGEKKSVAEETLSLPDEKDVRNLELIRPIESPTTEATVEPDKESNRALATALAPRTTAVDLSSSANPMDLTSTQVAVSDVVGESPAGSSTATKSTNLAVPSEDEIPPFEEAVQIAKEAAIPVVAYEDFAPAPQADEALVSANYKQHVEEAARFSQATATHVVVVDENPHVEQAAPEAQAETTQIFADERLVAEQAEPASHQVVETQLIAGGKPLVEQGTPAWQANAIEVIADAAPVSQTAEDPIISVNEVDKTLGNTDELKNSVQLHQEEWRDHEALEQDSNKNTTGDIEKPAEKVLAQKRAKPPKASRSCCCNWKCMLICTGALLVLASVAICAVVVPILVVTHARNNQNRGLRGVTHQSLGQFGQPELPRAKSLVQTALSKHTTRKSRSSNLRQPK